MHVELTRADVEKVARLSRLALSEAELDAMRQQLAAVLDYVEQLGQLDVSGVEPLAHCLPIDNVFRDDVLSPCLPLDEALANAPKRAADFFAVPAVFD